MKKFLTALFILSIWSSVTHAQEDLLNEAERLYNKGDYYGAIKTYKVFIADNPKSDNALFSYQQIAIIYFDNLKDYISCIKTYQILADIYPGTKEAKQSLFLIAFIYEETLNNKDMAIKKYKEFLRIYPEDEDPYDDDKMVDAAKSTLKVLESGKSIDELKKKHEN